MFSRPPLTPVPTLSPSPELRILLLCGSDLLESFCIPGLWNEADVSNKAPTALHTGAWERWGGGTWVRPLLSPPPTTSPPQPKGPSPRSSHRSQALALTAVLYSVPPWVCSWKAPGEESNLSQRIPSPSSTWNDCVWRRQRQWVGEGLRKNPAAF